MNSLLPRFFMAFSLSSTALIGGDWPQWRGPLRNGSPVSTEKLPSTLPPEPTVVWKRSVGEGLASPVVDQGKVFIFDNHEGRETIHALKQEDGTEIWKASIDEVFKDSQGPAGPRCTPLVNGGRIYVQSGRGELQCLDANSGKLHWRANYTTNFGAVFVGEKGSAAGASRHGNNGSPLSDGRRLIALVGGTNGQGVVAFDRINGKVLWASQEDDPAYAPPILHTFDGSRQVVCFMAEGLIGIEAESGKLLWRVPLKTKFARHVTTPVVHRDMVVVASHEFGLLGTRISKKEKEFEATPAWTNREAAINFSSPVEADGFLYGLGPRKNIMCVEMQTGKIAWSQEGYFQTSADKAHAGFLIMGPNILMLTDGGELVLFEKNAQAFKAVSRVQVCGLNWCNPAYSDGKLFVRDGIKNTSEVRCIDLIGHKK